MDVCSVAQSALETGEICDACVGRLVADRSFGLTNRERGRALRITLALAADEPLDPPDSSACWVCEGESDRVDTWADRAVAAARGYEFDTYQVGTSVPPLLTENDRLLREDVGLDPEAGEALNAELNREVGKRVGEQTDTDVDFERPDVLFVLDLAADEVDLQVNSAFVYGRYEKRERDIPQTEWPCRDCNATGLVQGEPCEGCGGTGYRYDRSVEQLTCPVVREAMDGTEAVFHGAGREDVDARMLGTGRPFVIEVREPRRRTVDLDAIADEIDSYADGAVAVSDLRLATHEMVERVKELDASKTYRMAVRFDEPVTAAALADALDALAGVTIHQETPARVDHRRASLTRERRVYEASGHLGEPERPESPDAATTATVVVEGEGGLYVKELVSGDDGRTEPSLAGLLGVSATVTALDVLAVEGEEEAFLQPEFVRSGA